MNWFSVAWDFIKGFFGGASASETQVLEQTAEAKGKAQDEADNAKETENDAASADTISSGVDGMSDPSVSNELRGWTIKQPGSES